MVNTTGRPTAPLVLSSDEREYLTRQVRRASSCAINVRTLPDHPAMWRWLAQ